jgi:hypothetical protein
MNEPYIWGDGGQLETTSSRARRRLAEALMQEGSSGTPIQSWTQGLNRVAQALVGGYRLGEEDRREAALEKETNDIIANHPAFTGMGAAPVAALPAVSPGVAHVTSNLTGRPSNHIYSNDEPSPLDPPSGSDRDLAIRTVLAEAADQGPVGMNAVGSVIRNRAVNGGFGGDTPSGVVTAPNQFEPWNTAAGRGRMAAIDPNGSQYAAAGHALDLAYAGNDPTNGATHFYGPKVQAALGRRPPAWDNGTGVDIGGHRFFGGAPQTTQVAQAEDPAAIPVNAQPTQGYAIPGYSAPSGPQIPPAVASWVNRAIRNPVTRASALRVMERYTKPVETYREETDDQGNVWSINQQTGQRTVALKHDRPEQPPTSVREYEYYRANLPPGQEPIPYDTWATAKARAAATTVTNNLGGGTDKQVFDAFDERSKAARATAQGLTGIRNAREAIEGGAITGFSADNRLLLQKAARYFGVPMGEAGKIENSEVFKAAIAPQIAAVLKATVGNANISDSDRRFAERAAGGSLDLDEGSIKRLLNIMERASVSHLQQYQEALDAVYPDPEKHKRERALFGVRVTPGGRAAGTTSTGRTWSVE